METIPVETYEATSIHDYADVVLHRLADPFHTLRGTWIYRGQTDQSWPLVPQILRAEYLRWRSWHPELKPSDQERELVRAFRTAAIAHTGGQSLDIWNWLALAQHHGLATRLLDWSYNPQVALYFAVRSAQIGTDSAVWCYKHADNGPVASTVQTPFDSDSIVFFEPPHVSPRISVQSGCFTSHPIDLAEQPWAGALAKIVVPHAARATIRRELFRFGIHEQSPFPDLDGLARQSNWRYSTFADEERLHPRA